MRAVVASVVALVLAAPALGADGEPKKALTPKGQAAAKSIVLTRSDLAAGFVPHKASTDARPKGARCGAVDESDLTVTGEADSPDFSRDSLGVAVGSSASVYKTLADSSTAWRRALTSAAVQCYADLVRLTAPSTAAVKIVSAKRMSFPQVTPHATVYRVVATLTLAKKRKVRAYFDAVLLRQGAVQASLVFTSLARPVPPDQEEALARLLAVRMAKAAGTGLIA